MKVLAASPCEAQNRIPGTMSSLAFGTPDIYDHPTPQKVSPAPSAGIVALFHWSHLFSPLVALLPLPVLFVP